MIRKFLLVWLGIIAVILALVTMGATLYFPVVMLVDAFGSPWGSIAAVAWGLIWFATIMAVLVTIDEEAW